MWRRADYHGASDKHSRETTAMVSMILAAAFWVALHFIVAGPLRPLLAAWLGEQAFRGLFALLSAAGLAWLVLAYRAAPYMPLWQPVPGAAYIALPLMFVAFLLLAFSIGAGNPTLAGADMLLKDRLPIHGITRITRHPGLWAFALWALAHLLANGDVAGVLLFGAILVTALNGMVSIDRKRHRALGRGWDDFAAQTSRVPFAAILAGRNTLDLEELSPWRAAVGAALFALALWLHGVIGVSPIPS
jgi:uncharacterized membrane protein